MLITILSGLAEPLGALIGIAVFSLLNAGNAVGFSLAFAAGVMTYITARRIDSSSPRIWIQATTNVRNKASQRVLEKAGSRIEGTMRKFQFVRGIWTDYYLHSILRKEWKESKILTRT